MRLNHVPIITIITSSIPVLKDNFMFKLERVILKIDFFHPFCDP